MNSWVKILLGFRNSDFQDYVYGLTPRFIIGVCQIPIGKKFDTEELAKEATLEMFNEMKAYNHGGLIVTSNYCEIHKGPVMRFCDTKWTENTIGTTFEKIWDRYGKEITSGDYSISIEERKIVEGILQN